MPLGDQDVANGVFFSDWSRIVFGNDSAFCILDAAGKDSAFDHVSVSNTDYTVMLSAIAFNPMPKAKDQVAVDGVSYAVQSSSLVDDGAMVELKLRKI